MKLSYTDEQRHLASTMAEFFSESSVSSMWAGLAAFGALGMTVAEDLGGEGAGVVDLGLVARASGARVAQTPFAPTAVLATLVLSEVGGELAEGLLKGIVSGTSVVVVPWSVVGQRQRVGVPELAGGSRVTGSLRNVPWVQSSDSVVFQTSDRSLVVADVQSEGVTWTSVDSFDGSEPLADVTFEAVPLQVLALGAQAEIAVAAARDRINAVLAMELVGTGQAILDMAVDYAKIRTQFDRPIGSFQSLKHMLADAHIQLDAASALAHAACHAVDTRQQEAGDTARLALASSMSAARTSALNSMQSFGGIGYTWEQGSHVYLRRVLARRAQLGSTDQHLEIIADSVLGTRR